MPAVEGKGSNCKPQRVLWLDVIIQCRFIDVAWPLYLAVYKYEPSSFAGRHKCQAHCTTSF